MNINTLIESMTLEEKASLCSGVDFWHTQPIERLGIPAMMVSDGPHGLRKQDLSGDHLGINDSIKAVCFPTGCTVASSFDKELIHDMGKTLGNECQAEGVGVLLGPAMNIKRSPLCGRNFEYFSEDPYVSSTMAAAQIKGIQSQKVGTSIKHFLANNQEHRRMTSDSLVDERTLREIYLASFETAVKEAKPWTVMCSYNKINGTYAAENHRFLTEILRDEWGFDGFVMSDWGAVNNRVEGVKAGMDLEMPSSGGANDRKIVEAIKKGELSMDVLDENVSRILRIVDRSFTDNNTVATFDLDADHEKARIIARESMVLLKNESVLPIQKTAKVAFIGEFAKNPRFQGGGSSHINCHKISDALECGKRRGLEISYAQGYDLNNDHVDERLIDEACQLAKDVEVVVLFVGLPDAYESEGYDRKHMLLPENHNALIQSVAEVQENVIIVLHNGSPIEMPWISKVKGVLESYLAGQAVGEAVVDILFGDANPSGKLAESFPLKLEDNPSYLFYRGEKDKVEYREGIFVGYRYYDKKKMNVLFPFGHGLSYTSFEYTNLRMSHTSIDDSQLLEISIDVTNIGSVSGKEVVQVYVNPSDKGIAIRPVRELKGYDKISLEPKETKTLRFLLDKRAFAYYNVDIKDWYVESGNYGIEVGASSRDIRLSAKVEVISTQIIPNVFNLNSTIGDLLEDPKASQVIMPYMNALDAIFSSAKEESAAEKAITDEMKVAMLRDLPIRNLVSFSQGQISEEALLSAISSIEN